MTRDPVDAAEIEHDLASQKGMDVESVENEIIEECEDLKCHDWVHEKGRDPADFQLEVARLIYAPAESLGIEATEPHWSICIERMARIRGLFNKEFQFYAQKRAAREAHE